MTVDSGSPAGRNPQCVGSRGGTDLASFRVASGRWWGCCGACGGVVPITIDGRAMPHQEAATR